MKMGMSDACGDVSQLNPCRYSIVLISNQKLKPQQLENWKKKIPLISAAVSLSHLLLHAFMDEISFLGYLLDYLQRLLEMAFASLCQGCGMNSNVFLQ